MSAKSKETKTSEEAAAEVLAELDNAAQQRLLEEREKELKKKSEGIRVFVYGTLKAGKSNHRLLQTATYLGRARVKGKYEMVDLGWYPGVVHKPALTTEQEIHVYGEVYRIDQETLDMLDALEGHPNYYCRTQVHTPWKKAWCYFLPESFLGRNLKPLEPALWRPSEDEKTFYIDTETAGIGMPK